MTYNTDLEFYLKQCTALEREAGELLQQCEEAEGNEKRTLLRSIEQKINRAREYVMSIQTDLVDLTDPQMLADYTAKGEEHDQQVKLLEAQYQRASRQARDEEQARAQGISPQDLMGRARDLQEEQKRSLDNDLYLLGQIQDVGAGALEEINRQKGQLESTSGHLTEMDSELARAKKIMKVMITRAAGDNCVRLLAILVIIAVVVVIVVEAVMPGSTKEQVDSWFGNDQTE
jgi:t-SNARE complex subunit (syntaxin)